MTVHPFIEESLLGDCLYNPEIIPEVAIALRDGKYFGVMANQQLFGIMFNLYASYGNVSLSMLVDVLKSNSTLEQFGGLAYLQSLANNSLDSRAWQDHVEVIKTAALIREIDRTGDDMKSLAARGQLDKALDSTQQRIDDIRRIHKASTSIVSFSTLATNARERISRARVAADPVQGLRLPSTPRLERLLGGIVGGWQYMIYGSSSMGKSTLAVSFARDLVPQAPGLIATTEMTPDDWFLKLVAALCKIDSDRVRYGGSINPFNGQFEVLTDRENALIDEAILYLDKQKCHVLTNGSPTIADIGTHLRAGIREYGYSWFICDSASKVAEPDSDNIYWTTRNVGDGLQNLCLETRIPFIITAQVKPEVASRANKIPRTEDAAGGATFGNNADIVISLYNHHHYIELDPSLAPNPDLPEGTILARITKHRHKGARNKGSVLQIVSGACFYESDNQAANAMKLF